MAANQTVFLILASRPGPLQALLQLLDGRFCAIVHLDGKANAERIRPPLNTIFVEPRISVFWGGFNMILAIRNMIDAAYDNFPGFSRLVTITGDTLPVVNLDELESRLNMQTVEYLYYSEVSDDPSLRGISWDDASKSGRLIPWRFHNFVSSDDVLLSPKSQIEAERKFNITNDGAAEVRRAAQTLTREVLSLLPQRQKLYERLYFGSSWWALTREAMDLIIDDAHSAAAVSYFRYLSVPDEHFFQTILGNKRRALSSLHRQFEPRLVFVDYNNPERKAFTGRDCISVAEIRAAAKNRWLFARKFNPELSPEIATAISEGRYFSDILVPN